MVPNLVVMGGDQNTNLFEQQIAQMEALLKQQQQNAISLGMSSRDDSLRIVSQVRRVLTPTGPFTNPLYNVRLDIERRKAKAAMLAARMDKEIAALEKLEAEGMADEAEVCSKSDTMKEQLCLMRA